MSYILNALRKSEQDRHAKESSNPENNLIEVQPQQNPRVIWLVIVLIIINILVLIYFIFFMPQQTANILPAVENKTPMVEAPIQPEKLQIARKTELPKAKQITPKTTQPSKKTSSTPNQKTSISDMLEQRRTTNKKPVPEPTVKNVSINTNKTNSIKPTASRPAQPKTKPATVDQRPVQKRTKSKKPDNIPFLHEMPPAFRRNVPDLNINVFVYAKNPDDRFVIIDMKKYRTGQETSDGLEINEIKNDSLVLRYNNRTFQIERP